MLKENIAFNFELSLVPMGLKKRHNIEKDWRLPDGSVG